MANRERLRLPTSSWSAVSLERSGLGLTKYSFTSKVVPEGIAGGSEAGMTLIPHSNVFHSGLDRLLIRLDDLTPVFPLPSPERNIDGHRQVRILTPTVVRGYRCVCKTGKRRETDLTGGSVGI